VTFVQQKQADCFCNPTHWRGRRKQKRNANAWLSAANGRLKAFCGDGSDALDRFIGLFPPTDRRARITGSLAEKSAPRLDRPRPRPVYARRGRD
jgi:hypothetical protein